MNKLFTSADRIDGFGAQYQDIIGAILFTEMNGGIFCYKDPNTMEHNYDNDPTFLDKVSNYMGLKGNYVPFREGAIKLSHCITYPFVERDIDKCLMSDSMKKIKECFWKNKDKDHFKNNKINVAVHVRRHNSMDSRIEGTNTPDQYYLNIMNNIRLDNNNVLFHIYSQGSPDNFNMYKNSDVVLHLNESLFDTFTGLVAADILVTSASSFSYVAALISDGKIYYKSFWHAPSPRWIVN